jgi:branched-chain amino acid aminotransferase
MAIHRFVLHNGRIREAGEAMLSPGQLGLLAGWGLFSTLRVSRGVLFAWERHWARLSRDAALMNVALPEDAGGIYQDLIQLIEANQAQNSTLRLVIFRNSGVTWEGPPTGRASDVIAMTTANNKWSDGVKLMYQPGGRFAGSDFATAKITSWGHNLRMYERAHEQGFDECVLLNERGEVTECTSANIFAVHRSEVWTAPVSAGCLPGITRELLLEEVRVPGVRVIEKTLLPTDLESADDVFITSSTRDLVGVSQIGDKALNTCDNVRTKLLVEFRRYLHDYVESRQPVNKI